MQTAVSPTSATARAAGPPPHPRPPSLIEKPDQHVPDMVLAAEEHRKDASRLPLVVDVEPVDRPSDGEVAQPGQEVIMALAAMGAVTMRSAAVRISRIRVSARSRAFCGLSPKSR